MGIDEVENGIHHSVLADVFKVLIRCASQDRTQLMLTTHSAEALTAISGAVTEADKQAIGVVHLHRDEKDTVRANVFAGADAIASIQLGYELR